MTRFLWTLAVLTAFASQCLASDPIFDRQCRLTPRDREARLLAAKAKALEIQQGIEAANQSLAEFEKISHEVKMGYHAADIADGISTVASMIALGGVVKSLVTRTGLVIFGHLISTGGALTMTGTRVGTLGFSFYVLFKKKSLDAQKLRLTAPDGKELQAESLDQLLDLQLEDAKTRPLLDDNMRFLADPDCSTKACDMSQPDIDGLFHTLDSWEETEEKHAHDLDAWWKPDEVTHLFGESIDKIEIPYTKNGIRLLTLERKYYLRLVRALQLDGAACALGASFPDDVAAALRAPAPGAETSTIDEPMCKEIAETGQTPDEPTSPYFERAAR